MIYSVTIRATWYTVKASLRVTFVYILFIFCLILMYGNRLVYEDWSISMEF